MADAATSTPDLVFYDIAFRPPHETSTCAPNPWKSRYALNFKSVPYKTRWTPIIDIAKVRQSLDVSAGRQFADGTDFYTLPMLQVKSENRVIGDSFDIAVYLQENFPDNGAGALFPEQELEIEGVSDEELLVPLTKRDESNGIIGKYARFNRQCDSLITPHVILMATGFPFDPANEKETKELWAKRAGVPDFDMFEVKGEVRAAMMKKFNEALTPLATILKRNSAGPFLMGETPSYADLTAGGWLKMMAGTLPKTEWEDIKTWHDGIFGQLYDALERFAAVN